MTILSHELALNSEQTTSPGGVLPIVGPFVAGKEILLQYTSLWV
jgi:hypothetical protein